MVPSKTPSVPALERALAVLELVAKSRTGLTFSQIARNLDFPQSSIHCLLLTFERQGYMRRSEATGRYVCSSKLFRIANLALDGFLLREKVGPPLRQLVANTGLTTHMAVIEENEIVLIYKAEPQGPPHIATWVGKHIDAHCTSLGKSLLAHLPEADVQRMTRERGFLRHNENTICSLQKLKQELAKIRAQGYAIDDEEEEIGIRCIGVPVFGPGESVIASISVSGTTEQIHSENGPRLCLTLQESARRISEQLRSTPDAAWPSLSRDQAESES
jgi:DNA-binding IclR family transcriptional regulator